MKRPITLFFALVYVFIQNISAQSVVRYNTFQYNVNQGMLQSSVNEIVFDENNFAWLSYTNGLQKFDGERFNSIAPREGLPEVSDLNFFKTKSGTVLFSYRQGISRYDIHKDKFIPVYHDEKASPLQRKFFGETGGVIYFISPDGFITGLDNKTFKKVLHSESRLTFIDDAAYQNLIVGNNLCGANAVVYLDKQLYLIDLETGKEKDIGLLPVLPYVISLHLLNDHEILFYSAEAPHHLLKYNFLQKAYTTLHTIPTNSSKVFRSVIYNWQNNIIVSNFNETYIADSTFKLIHRLVNYQNHALAGNDIIKNITEDNFGNLYLLTLASGFVKVIADNYPIRYFGAAGTDNNFVISLLADKKNNQIIGGTNGNGIMVFDTLQNLVRHIKYFPNSKKSFSPSAIIKHENEYYLFIFPEKKIWVLDKNFNWRSSIPIENMSFKDNIDYYSKILFQNEKIAIVQSGSSFYKIDFEHQQAKRFAFSNESILSALFFNGQIIAHANDLLYCMDTSTFKISKTIPLKNTGGVRCYTTDKSGNIFIGANKGIFKLNASGKILQHLTRETGLPDDCIYAMTFDKSGALWCSSNKGIFKVGPDNKILQLTKEDGLQENEFNTDIVQASSDGELYFGGVNGISSFYPAAINNFNEQIHLLFTDIKINNKEPDVDSPPWRIHSLTLPYDKNYISFDFVAMANNNPSQYIYQYKMEPIDKEWIQSDVSQTIRYQLPPGKYVFKIYAGKSFNTNAKAIKEISIYIMKPFWQTWWFYLALGATTIVLLAILINRFNHARYVKKLRMLENETRIRKERERISRDLHDNIGAYANAVLYNTELLEKEEEASEQASIMKELRFASKDIISSLRETIWALKKENYSAEECLFRIKNFVQPISRYYPKINFKIQGTASAEKILSYQRALNIVRVAQEAISNAIKHGDANTIYISSEQQGETWKIIIEDDGCGFDSEEEKDSTGNGLENMAQRAKDGDFDVKIMSQPETGTTIEILII